MARYVRQYRGVSLSMGPTEERGAGLWIGYDIDDVDDDLTAYGLIRADELDRDRLEALSITEWIPVRRDDEKLLARLGISHLTQ